MYLERERVGEIMSLERGGEINYVNRERGERNLLRERERRDIYYVTREKERVRDCVTRAQERGGERLRH